MILKRKIDIIYFLELNEGLKYYIYISIMLLLLFSIYESCAWICFSPKNGHQLKRNSNIFQFNLHF